MYDAAVGVETNFRSNNTKCSDFATFTGAEVIINSYSKQMWNKNNMHNLERGDPS